jgi:hypothetical protein
LEGVDIDGPKIQDYSDPFGFSSNACGFSRYPHVRNKKIERLKKVACGKGGVFGIMKVVNKETNAGKL